MPSYPMSLPTKIPRTVWVLGFTSLLNDTSSEMIHAVLPLFLTTSLGASALTVGAIEGIAEATASILKVFSGAISDYWQRRKGLAVLGYGFSTAMKPLFLVANSPAMVLLARFGDRIGKGIRVAPRDALVADATDASNRGAAYGLRQSLDTIGAILGPLLAMVLMSATHSFQSIFALALIPGFLAVAILFLGVQEPRQPYQALKKANPLHWSTLQRLGWPYWGIVIAAFLFNLGNSSEAFLLLQASHLGINAAQVPLVLVAMNLSYALSAYPVGILSDPVGRVLPYRQSKHQLLLWGWGLYVLIYLGLGFTHSPELFWMLVVLYGLYLGMTQGVLLALIADRVPSDLRGTAFGFLNLSVGVALLPASLLAGWLWQTINPSAAFISGGGLALAAILVLCKFA
jgi:MFS family permease